MRAFVFCLIASFVAVVKADEQYTLDSIQSHFDACAAAGEPIEAPVLRLNVGSMTGHVGRLFNQRNGVDIYYRVFQQIDEGTLVNVHYYSPGRLVVVDPYSNRGATSAIYGKEDTTVGPFLFKYQNVASLADNATFEPNGLWKVSGTFTYVTAAGSSRTVLVVEPLPDGDLKLPEKMPHRFLYKHTARQWNKLNGESFANGIYLGYKDGVVWVMTPESEIKKSSLFDLSKEDQLFVRQQLKERRRTWLIPEIEKELKDKAAGKQ